MSDPCVMHAHELSLTSTMRLCHARRTFTRIPYFTFASYINEPGCEINGTPVILPRTKVTTIQKPLQVHLLVGRARAAKI